MKNYYLYLIRHGITEGNLDGKYIGQTDLALCPQGEKQIQQLVKAGVYPYVEKVYTSPLNLPEYTAWLKGGPEACPPDGEKFGDFSLRCISGLDIIFRDMMKKEITRAAMVTHGGVITNLLAGFGLPKGHPADYMCGPGEGFEILLSTFLWQKGPAFEISGRLF